MGILLLVLIGLVVGVMFANYDSKDSKGWEAYLIKKGRHYSIRVNRPFPTPYKFSFQRGTLRFTAFFGSSCVYDSTNNDSIHKLYGVSYGGDHHYRSVRIGWRYNSNLRVIELFIYAYVRGKRIIKPMFNVQIEEEIQFTMFRTKNNIVVIESILENGSITVDYVAGIDKSFFEYKLWPYFGGIAKSPHDMQIFIK
jgi:hypothetical protein